MHGLGEDGSLITNSARLPGSPEERARDSEIMVLLT